MKKYEHFIFLTILFLVLILYFPGINAYFVNDDYNWIKPISLSDILRTYWGGWGHGALYRPLIRTLFYIEYLLFGTSPAGYHLVSIMIYSITVFMFYKLTLIYYSSIKYSFLIIGLLVFYYPNHEVVCWISTQTVLLCVLLSLFSIYFYLKYDATKNRSFIYFSILSYLMSLLTYEISVITPILILLLVLVKDKSEKLKLSLVRLSPYLLLTVIYIVFRHLILQGLPDANKPNLDPVVMLSNFFKMINLQIIAKRELFVVTIISFIVVLFVKKDFRVLLLGLLWLISSFVPFMFIDGYTGRFSYYPMFGIILIIASGFYFLIFETKKLRYLAVTILAYYFVFNAVQINKNSRYWHEAGEIAKSIPVQLKNMHSGFPDNSTLIFFDIPLGYKQSGVFLTYFEDAIQNHYNEKLKIIHVSHPFNRNLDLSLYENQPNTYKFKYFLDERQLKQLK